jgi:hypothetical protein
VKSAHTVAVVEDEDDEWFDAMENDDDYVRRDGTADGDEEYPRFRLRRIVVRAVALLLIVGLLLAFPLGYLLDTELRNQHLEAGVALIEAVVVVVIIAALRSRRRL